MIEQGSPPPTVITWSNVEYYLSHGLDATFSMNGLRHPRVDYVVLGHRTELRVELTDGQRAPISRHPMLEVDETVFHGRRFARLQVADSGLQREFLYLVCAMAERVTVHGHSVGRAFAETVRGWSALLRTPHVLSHWQRVGLFGELTVLWSLGYRPGVGWAHASTAWLGFQGEEHDFALAEIDVEVKTTTSVRRHHVIHGAAQLTAKPGRALWLVSIQLTHGGNAGVTLAELGAQVRSQLAVYAPHRIADLDDSLAAVRDNTYTADSERWVFASAPQVFAVTGDFPRIDDAFLDTLPPSNRARIDELGYRLDLTGLPPAAGAPEELSAIHLPDATKLARP